MQKSTNLNWLKLTALLLITLSFTSNEAYSANQENTEIVKKSQQAEQEALLTLKSISKDIQILKSDVVTLNKDIRLVEEELLFPSSTKYTVFVSMNGVKFFTLQSVKLKLDGKLVTSHIYSEKQRQSLANGGIQKLYITNLNQGKHQATAFFTGLGPNGRQYKLAKNLGFEKGPSGEYLELAIRDDGEAQEAVIHLKQW